MVLYIRAILLAFRGREDGQASLEYMLAVGAFSAVIASVFITLVSGIPGIADSVVPEVLRFLCDAVDPLGGGNCIDVA